MANARREDAASLPCRVLTIAGSDSGGGAGLQADLKVVTCLGGYAMSAVTAITAQNTLGVTAVRAIPPDDVAAQVEACLADIGADAVKTGMLCNAPIVRAVAEALRTFGAPHLVVDPVMVSKSEHRLLDAQAEETLIRELLPLCEVVTPNLPEATRLAGFEICALDDMRRAAEAVLALGPRAVLVKGGHLAGEAVDLLYDGREFIELHSERLDARNTHGTGCSFSAALAFELGCGRSLADAARRAKRFITEAIRNGLPLGGGHGPTNPRAAAQAL